MPSALKYSGYSDRQPPSCPSIPLTIPKSRLLGFFFAGMFIRHRQTPSDSAKLRRMNCQTLVSALEEFLSGSSNAVVIEDDSQLFDLAQAKYSVSGESKIGRAHV